MQLVYTILKVLYLANEKDSYINLKFQIVSPDVILRVIVLFTFIQFSDNSIQVYNLIESLDYQSVYVQKF